ncbi:unnamed protein product [Lepeophtheirus salmonis]|uniref:(salmon louse) hypothetical protein n=1 Tax=Lepeophtheirus salmonis TaxID=72036 RepID=A0A7R8H2C9_LEPSM|nr:unnamed protein product [Lepeophtheirus salmonis]CAF2811597.1 unnamed protein product [Lepeophtheirus salmonis]
MDIDTMKPLKVVSPEVEIGQRTAMSPLDVEKVNEMFKCPSKEGCGQSNFMKTSCGGTNINYTRESKPQEFPWNAYLVKSEGWKSLDCGGVLIKDNIFLFAASCFDGYSANEEYQPLEPVLSDGVVPICLPTNSSHYYEGRAATYTYVNNKTETERAMQVQKFSILKVVSNDGFGLKKENTKIVAKRGFQFDANEIVSGPLVMKENGDCTVIGISSKLNVSETNSNISDEISFTRVDQYLDWIEESIIKLLEQ